MPIPHKLAICALIMGALFDVLFYNASGIGINLLLAELVFLAGSAYLAKETRHRIPHHAWIAAMFAVVYSATFAVWTSGLGMVIGMIGFLSSNFLFAAFTLGHHGAFRHPLDILWNGTIDTGYKMLSRLHIIGHLKPKGINVRQSILMKGLLVAFPLLVIFVLLFASADPIFARYADAILFDWIDTVTFGRIIGHAIFIGFFAFAFLLFFAAAYWERFSVAAFSKQLVTRFESESMIVVGSIAALFGLFLLIQARTLLGGEAAWDATGLTYAEYVHQGFYQLIFASALVLAVILTLRLMHGAEHKVSNILHLVLLGETILVLLSAVRRLALYVDAYGYTPSRLFAYWVMLLIATLIGILVWNIGRRQDQMHAMQHGLIALGILGFLFIASSPDALSASLNIQAAQSGRRPVDIVHLLILSPEASSVIHVGLKNELPIEGLIYPSPASYCGPADGPIPGASADRAMRKQIMNWYDDTSMIPVYDDVTGKRLSDTGDWQSWNLSRSLLIKERLNNETPEWITDPFFRNERCG